MHIRRALRICDTENVNASKWKKDILFHARYAKERNVEVLLCRLEKFLFRIYVMSFFNIFETKQRHTN